MRKILLTLLVLIMSTVMYANESVTMNLVGKGVNQGDAAAQVVKLLGCNHSQFVVANEKRDNHGMIHVTL